MDRRTQIMKAAFEMMADKGLEAVHARTVADKLKINHATVHYYFKTRPDLLAGVAEFALAQLGRDRAALGEALSPRDVVENELALAEAYSRPASRMANVLVALCAAKRSEPSLKDPVGKLISAFVAPVKEAAGGSKMRKSSPFGEGELLSELLLGVLVLAHLTEDNSQVEATMDTVHGLMFKG